MGILDKFRKSRRSSEALQEWIAVYFVLHNGEFGSEEEREIVHKFTDKLSSVIREHKVGVFDGDEYGNGRGALFMYGPNANRLFDVVYPLLSAWSPLKGGYAIKRYGTPERAERVEF